MAFEQQRVKHIGFDVEEVLPQLTTDEKISLLSGRDFWHTTSVPRLNIPSIRVSDGPNGVRGTKFFLGVPAACLPCGTGLAATWDTELIERGGQLQGREAIAKGASVILGPTTNMQRGPLGGRGYESYSEDPLLAGNMSAATIKGIQSNGVAATLKHYVCNDSEHERQSVDCLLTERTLREIYLMPFQIAQRDSQPMSYMTSYNKVNGTHVSECPKLLKDILRGEWGFNGMVMSDWFGTYSASESVKAGLDLEMPGPSYIRGKQITQAITSGKLDSYHIDNCVREVLKFVEKLLPLGIPENAPEGKMDTPETSQLLRDIASNGIVLLKNDQSILPFKKDKTTAVIGPNANTAMFCGGGSAALDPYYAISPLEGIRKYIPDAKYELGAPGYKKLPLMSNLTETLSGQKGMEMRVYLEPLTNKSQEVIDKLHVPKSMITLSDYKHEKITSSLYYVEVEATFTPEETATYQFSLSCAGTGKIFVDGECVVDNETKQVPGDSFFGSGTRDETGEMKMEKDKTYHILTKFGTLPTITFRLPGASMYGAGGLRLGLTRKVELKPEIQRAVELAKSVDQVVLCAGLNSEWESEGYDRRNMDLPPGSDELISAVLAANPNTVIINQSGTPVTMPWLPSAHAVLQAWYGGNETGNAIADVLFGTTNPSGRLSLTFPFRNEDNPAFLNFRSDRQRMLYGEGVYIGYRYYEKTQRPVAFPFGHGLSYTTFAMSNLHVETTNDTVTARVDVTNTGSLPGAQVVQVYISQDDPSVSRPVKELKGFKKVVLDPGETKTVAVEMAKKYACSFWDEARDAWVMERGGYQVLVGDSSANVPLSTGFVVDETSWWRGL